MSAEQQSQLGNFNAEHNNNSVVTVHSLKLDKLLITKILAMCPSTFVMHFTVSQFAN